MYDYYDCNIVWRGASKLLELVSNPFEYSIKYVQNKLKYMDFSAMILVD
jgi:hypothetical protein